MLFPVDHGNSSIKTVNFVFSSGLADYPIRPPVDTDILEYGGKYWTLSGKRISYMRDKTKDDRYFILTLFAIAKELQKSDTMSPMVETDLALSLIHISCQADTGNPRILGQGANHPPHGRTTHRLLYSPL